MSKQSESRPNPRSRIIFISGTICGTVLGLAASIPNFVIGQAPVTLPREHPLMSRSRQEMGLVQRVADLEKLLSQFIQCDNGMKVASLEFQGDLKVDGVISGKKLEIRDAPKPQPWQSLKRPASFQACDS